MASRLDKLFELLESNHQNIRNAAAIQIGQLSANNQVNISALLAKLLPYAKHKIWVVRIAASDAVRHIGNNAKLWVPGTSESNVTNVSNLINLENLNLHEILKIGTRLYSRDFKDLDEANTNQNINRDELARHLGFLIPDECEIKNLITVKDCELVESKSENKMSVELAVRKSMENLPKKPVKRHHEEVQDVNEPGTKMKCVEKIGNETERERNTEWPWVDFCEELLKNLWDAKWEIRHGAATCLRELIRSQGSIMLPKNADISSTDKFAACHERFQEEIAVRLLCTLTLDQLSDFVSDEMVAPVRESCAQALGVISVHLTRRLVEILANQLLSLLNHDEWRVNHGALLGLKYLLAARMDLVEVLLPIIYDPISSHLKGNCDDDVRCAAVAALMPLFGDCCSNTVAISNEELDTLKTDLWDVLAVRIDCTTSGATCAVLQLLERLYEKCNVVYNQSEDQPMATDRVKALNEYINRLHWCYFNYSDLVRLAAVRTCRAVLQSIGTKVGTILEHGTILQVLSQLVQRVLIDDNCQVAAEAHSVWNQFIDSLPEQLLARVSCERLEIWMCSAMQPARLSYTPGSILMPDYIITTAAGAAATVVGDGLDEDDGNKHHILTEFYIGGRESFITDGSSAARDDLVLGARLAACQLLARLCQRFIFHEAGIRNILISIIAQIHLKDRLAVQRFVASMILAYWDPDHLLAMRNLNDCSLSPLQSQLLTALEEPIYYQEILSQFKQMHKACRDLMLIYIEREIPLPPSIMNAVGPNASPVSIALNISQCQSLISSEMCSLCPPESMTTFSCATAAVDTCAQQHATLCRLVDIAVGRALLQWGWLPLKLTPLIKPLISAVRSETCVTLQTEACIALAQLVVDHNSQTRLLAPVTKLVKNLIQYQSEAIDSLATMQPHEVEQGEIVAIYKTSQLGREAFPRQEDNGTAVAIDNDVMIKLRGSRLALEKIYSRFVSSSESDLDHSFLMEIIYHAPLQLLQLSPPLPRDRHHDNNSILVALRAMNTCLPFIKHASNRFQKISLACYAQSVFQSGLSHIDPIIRHWSARVLAMLVMPQSAADNIELSSKLLDLILLGDALKALEMTLNEKLCYGAIELIYLVCHSGLLPYRLAIAVIILPVVLACLNAPFDPLRRVATHVFSLLLTLLPLESSGADLSILTPARQQQRKQHLSFLDSLLNPKLIGQYNAHHSVVSAKLRQYQEEGVNWLGFLNRYGLHGVLADDMGLGKTLQAICVIAGEYSRAPSTCPPSLIVCPPTLTVHWHQEFKKFLVNLPDFNTIVYLGTPMYRQCIFNSLSRYQVVITSYDTLRSDMNLLARPTFPRCGTDVTKGSLMANSNVWNYVVLDEGHLIRNYKSKVAVATRALCARHRLVLTGTPIQNRVGELWSLFDFLMPGLLGTCTEFNRRYGRVLEQNGSNSGRKVDSETGTLALELLHRQVLPFMLRRVKDDVLQELPPKIMQDYMCTMSPLQLRLYTHCMESQAATDTDFVELVDKSYKENSAINQHRHGFQAMHYLRLVCNHPSLGLTSSHPLYRTLMRELAANNQCLDDINLSGKLVALRQLILDCGVGVSGAGEEELDETSVVASNRLLVFCQSIKMMELVDKMIRNEIPKATHLRLDGSVPAKDRQQIVEKFSCDASIDILLLTTSIGGLGLNLTSANIVIFVEHDWNPMRDLQAMDRAHRIGQKHTVIVYRLITAQSIEEKIMNLQEFKKFLANAVVSKDNNQMASMNTENILEIMNKEANWPTQSPPASANGKQKVVSSVSGTETQLGSKSVLSKINKADSVERVYDCLDEYDQEYNLDSFVKKL